MSLTIDLAALDDMWTCGGEWYQWMTFGCFSEDVAFAHHFVAPHAPALLEC